MFKALGLMSGTSTDGVDIALIETDGETILKTGASAYFAYSAEQKTIIQSAFGEKDRASNLCKEVDTLITSFHIDAVKSFMKDQGLKPSDIDMIGFHGQTITHAPHEKLTIQLGDGHALSQAVSVPVVFDFRSEDVSLGGQGAPLVPVYHKALMSEYSGAVALVNIGGVANITLIGDTGNLVSFDTGTGNALIDDWMKLHQKGDFDIDGKCARSGTVDGEVLAQLMSHSYFSAPYPKSLDRNDFSINDVKHLSLEDGAATLTAFSATAVVKAINDLPEQPNQIILCGGGRHNTYLCELIQKEMNIPVLTSESCQLDGDMIEAEAFAFLAVRSYLGLPSTFPETTGVPYPLTVGVKTGFVTKTDTEKVAVIR